MNLWTALVAIAGIIGIVQITRYRLESRRAETAEPDPHARETIERLEERVRTLERIVTDDKEALKRRFDDL
ncbi:hypothetical protein HFP89_12455 [Wenzhouxiangella sp. XN79A]|uniref:hypothetical protein n=1 Tax=Wenzhouxiangella sp. XN79A TaxID=2724193 RepID=UPI00144A6A80|nr:hypothetical protein [Wenzhouxiangella sp. XN79A]NKI35974.1 hypothetical protein [Wenzhouxiangella sp. XN79A]